MLPHAHFIEMARSWLGVPFAHQGRSRAGVDCAGLVICVARQAGLVAPDFDVNGYRRQPDGSMLAICDEHLQPVDDLAAAHVATVRFSVEPQHVALVTPYRHGGQALLHALQNSGGVVEHRMDRCWRARVLRAYRFPGVH